MGCGRLLYRHIDLHCLETYGSTLYVCFGWEWECGPECKTKFDKWTCANCTFLSCCGKVSDWDVREICESWSTRSVCKRVCLGFRTKWGGEGEGGGSVRGYNRVGDRSMTHNASSNVCLESAYTRILVARPSLFFRGVVGYESTLARMRFRNNSYIVFTRRCR